jgi:molybdenum cofactor cytidylyltransferase
MGRAKALLAMPGGGCFLSRLASAFLDAGCADLIVVTGPATVDRVAAAVERDRLPIRLAVNHDPSRGQLSSLHVALAVLEPIRPPALLVCPVDQPLVRAETIRLVIRAWRESGAPVVRPECGGRHGHPVLFDARVLRELQSADPALGARSVVRAHAAELLDVETDDAGAFEDIDTPEDYRRVFGVDVPSEGNEPS